MQDKRLRVHINGIQWAEIALSTTQVFNNSDYCIVGNSLSINSPFSGNMRHLIYQNFGYNASFDITQRAKSMISPNDTTILAYFRFGKYFNFQEDYKYNITRNFTQQNVRIDYSNEIETVCYCTRPSPSFLRVQNSFKLKILDMSPFTAGLDPNDKVTLYVDDIAIQTLSHSVILPTRKPLKLSIMPQVNVTFSTFTQNLIFPSFQQNNMTSGKLVFEANNQMCSLKDMYNSSQFVYGNSCKTNRYATNFTNQIQSTSLTAQLKSLMQNMTIELWIKDYSQLSANSKTVMVLFENSGDSKNALAQISILSGTQDDVRQLRVTPNVQSSSTKNLQLQNVVTENQWIHIAVTSTIAQLRIIQYNHNQKQQYSNQTTLEFQQYQSNQGYLNTSLGSNINGANKFIGLIREFRLWAELLSDSSIEMLRYSNAARSFGFASSGRQILMHNFRLNDGYDYQNLYDSMQVSPSQTPLQLDEKDLALSSFNNQEDSELVVCPQEYFYDGMCCQFNNITGLVDFNFTYSQSLSRIVVQIAKHSNLTQSINSLYGDFKLISVGNNYNQSYIDNEIRKLFEINKTQGFMINTALINPLLFNITIVGRLYSAYSERIVTVQKTISLICPVFKLSLNQMEVATNDIYQLSNKINHIVQFQVTQIYNQCYNNVSRLVSSVSMSKVAWSYNLTKPTFSSAFDISTNTYTLTQKYTVADLNSARLIARITYGTGQTLDYFADLRYTSQLIVMNNNALSVMQNQLIDESLTISLKDVQVDPNPEFSLNPQFSVACPAEIFKDNLWQSQLCKMSGSNLIIDLAQYSNLNIILSKKYQFVFLIKIQGTYLQRLLTLNMTFYKDGSSRQVCPQLMYKSNYTYDKVNDFNYEIKPEPFLFCYGTFYEILSVSWTTYDQINRKTLNNILYLDPELPLSIYLRNNNTNLKALNGGSVLTFNGTFNLRQVSATSISNAQIQFTNQLVNVSYKSNNIVPVINMLSFSKQAITNRQIGFLEPNVTLDGFQSYDPDNSTAQLWFSWSCPSQISNCSSMQTGTRSSQLVIDIWTRFRAKFQYNTNYTFKLTVWSKDNTFKAAQTLDYPVMFSNPSPSDTNIVLKTTNCEALDLLSLGGDNTIFRMNNSFDRVLVFTRANYSQVQFNASVKIDNGILTQKSPCGNVNITSQLLMFYPGDDILSSNQGPVQLSYIESPFNFPRAQNITLSLNDFSNLGKAGPSRMYNASIYQVIQRQSRTFVNVQTIYFQRLRANLVIQLDFDEIEVDKFGYLIINATKTFDSETDIAAKKYNYTWTCPLINQNCSKFTSSILNISATDRSIVSANAVGSSLIYTVQATDSVLNQQSDVYSIQVQITEKSDYSECIITSINRHFDNANNNTIYIDYNSRYNTIITMYTKSFCNGGVNLREPIWENSNNQSDIFWSADSSSKYKIIIQPASLQNYTSKPLVISFVQRLTMGAETKVYQYQSFVNIVINPPKIIPKASGQFIYFDGIDENIVLDGSKSQDPWNQSFTCSWQCPLLFDQKYCSTNLCQFNISLSDIKADIGDDQFQNAIGLTQLFTLTVISVDNKRTASTPWSIYITNQQQIAFDDPQIRNCQIKTMLNNGKFVIERINSFKLDCGTSSVDLTKIWNNYDWTVDGLISDSDYQVQDNILTIYPYTAALIDSHYLNVSINVKLVNSTRRTLQMTDQQFFNQLKIFIPTRETNWNIQGTVQIICNDDQFKFYTSNFTFKFINFTYDSRLYFQLREYSKPNLDQQVLIPLKPFTAEYVNLYYKNFTLPDTEHLIIDFYDYSEVYVQSIELSQDPVILNMTQNNQSGSYLFNDFDKKIFPLIQKAWNFPTTQEGLAVLHSDYFQLSVLIEMLDNDMVFGAQTFVFSNYAQAILAYLRLNLDAQLGQFDPSVSIDSAQSYHMIQKRVLLIIYRLIGMGSKVEEKTLSSLNVLNSCVTDYDNLVSQSENPELIRTVVLYIQTALKIQLVDLSIGNKQQYFGELSQITQQVTQNDIKKSDETEEQVITVNTESNSRTIFKVQDSNLNQLQITNGLNNQEKVYLPSKDLLQQLGISQIIVNFQKELNESSLAQTSIDITAFDNGQKSIAVNMSDQQSSFDINFYLNQNVKTIINKNNNNKSSLFDFKAYCVYYMDGTGKWSNQGIKTNQLSENIIQCQSTHLSQFSVVYTRVDRTKVIIDDGNKTDNNTQQPKGIDESKYYQENEGAYIAAILITGLIPWICIAFALCHKYQPDKQVMIKNRIQHSACKIFWNCLKIYHPLFSSFFSLKNSFYAIPKIYHFLSLWIYVFAIILTTLIAVISINDPKQKNVIAVVIIAIIIEVAFSIFKPIYNYLIYQMYYKNEQEPAQKDNNNQQQLTERQKRKLQQQQNNQASPNSRNRAKNTQRQDISSRLKNRQNRYLDDKQDLEGGDTESLEDEESDQYDQSSQEAQYRNQSDLHSLNNNTVQRGFEETKLDLNRNNFADLQQYSQIGKKHLKPLDIEIDHDNNQDSPSSFSDTPRKIITPATHKGVNINLQDTANQDKSDQKLQQNEKYGPHEAINIMSMGARQLSIDNYNDFDKLDNINSHRSLPSHRAQPEVQTQRLEHQVKKDQAIEINDIEVLYENEHNFKGSRCCLLIIQIIILAFLMIVTFIVMRELTKTDLFNWIETNIAIVIILVIVIDIFRILVFSMIYSGKQPDIRKARCAALIFLGNMNYQALKSLNNELFQ
ncbi:UNKNOWN [Stylonychia lemnae]|uniref:Uncharacterized protein n=1 Tax=Stylonychia lemnae TaxID=5949 RepID=A0A078B341_STYLE|nr:UNKNOWN [Stylonychia lemnae]|eukprot:CDW87898.1 UNKNOWN [Stylonychia lemnae]